MPPPPRVLFADTPAAATLQTAEELASAIGDFFAANSAAVVLEDGTVQFDLTPGANSPGQYTLSTEGNRCTLHLWSAERNLVRRIVAATPRGRSLRLATQRFGKAQPRLLELAPAQGKERRTPTTREAARTRYLRLLGRVLGRSFPEWKPDGFRTARDLERSFGPAYARGSLLHLKQAWAVIGAGEGESAATVDGILTLGVLWLERCREQAAGRRVYAGLRIVVPRGMAALTLSRLAWMNAGAAQWQLYELDEASEELEQRDPDDSGNLRTKLVHRPDETAARERFAPAIRAVMELVPTADQPRIEQRLHGAAELLFLLHGLVFARARLGYAERTFTHRLEVVVGAGGNETPLTQENTRELAAAVAELCRRRYADAHPETRTHDPLYRAQPERWLESVLRLDLAPLTRNLAPPVTPAPVPQARRDDAGNRAEAPGAPERFPVIPRLDPHHVYSQVPAIAGASDRGMLDLLGVTADGRLAVIELKADDDLQLPLQGLDYWIRVRHHHAARAAGGAGEEFQQHGYFRDVALSPLPPRLYLVAPALRIHPATEIVLRYLSPAVEWHLLALDERWRKHIRVLWRKSGGAGIEPA